MSISKYNPLLALMFGLTISVNANADGGGGAGLASELTQMLNNFELVAGVAKQVETVNQLVETYKVDLDKLKSAKLAGQNLDPGANAISMEALNKEISATANYQASLVSAGASSADLRNDINQRTVEASLSGQTMPQYIQTEGAKIQKGDKRAIQRINAEEQYMRQVDDDYAVAKEMSGKINGTLGIQQSSQLLNTQMNRVIQQNARMTQIMAKANTLQGDAATKANDDAQKNSDYMNAAKKANDDNIAAQRALIRKQQ